MPRFATQDSIGNLRITIDNKLREYRHINGIISYYNGDSGKEYLTEIHFPNGEKVFYQGKYGQEKIVKKYILCSSVLIKNCEKAFHTYHFRGNPGREHIYKIELVTGGEINFNDNNEVTSYNLTPKQFQFFLLENDYLIKKIFHYESIIFPNYQPFLPLPPKPVIDNDDSEEEIVIKSPKRQSTRLESKRVKKNKVMEEEVYIDNDTIFIS